MAQQRYAATTKTPVDRSRVEIEQMLKKRGVSSFGVAWDAEVGMSVVGFRYEGRQYHIGIPAPDASKFADVPLRTRASALAQEEARIWRIFVLIIKSRLVAVDEGGHGASLPHRRAAVALARPGAPSIGAGRRLSER